MSWISDPSAWMGLLALVALEVVLGIDNIIFISIVSGKLPSEMRAKARQIGIGLALITRLALLFSITWVMSLKADLFHVGNQGISGKDLVLIVGGLFLIYKSVHEIHHKLEGVSDKEGHKPAAASLRSAIIQILILDVIFSLDSIITAVGMVKHIEIMVISVLVSVVFMLLFAGKVSDFVEKHPTIKMLALAFLVLIGVNLLGEGFGQHIEKGYTYFAMAFAVVVEMLNIKLRSGKPVHLKDSHLES